MTDITFTKREQALIDFIKSKANEHRVTVRIAGGYVRDKLLGIPSHDIDFAIEGMSGAEFARHCTEKVSVLEARPEQSKHLETAMARIQGFDIDFAGLRKETYTDSRIPSIETGTPREDASRRDLTINGLFYNIHTGEIEDYVGGVNDLESGVARTPLNAVQTFTDDPLRVLRCIRFCAKYDLRPHISIIEAANNHDVQEAFLSKISRERIFAEVIGVQEGDGWKSGFLTGLDPHGAMELVIDFGFMDILFSPRGVELNPWDTDQNSIHHDLSILYHTMEAVRYFNKNCFLPEKETAIVNMALICHDLGKRDINCRQLKDDGTYSYLTHDERSVELGKMVLDQMSCPHDIRDRVLKIVEHHMRFHALPDNPSDKSLRKILRDVGNDWKLLLLHSEADACGKVSVDIEEMRDRHAVFNERMLNVLEKQNGDTKVKRPINGHELAEMGVAKGPDMGVIFKALDEELLSKPGMTKEEAISWVLTKFNI